MSQNDFIRQVCEVIFSVMMLILVQSKRSTFLLNKILPPTSPLFEEIHQNVWDQIDTTLTKDYSQNVFNIP